MLIMYFSSFAKINVRLQTRLLKNKVPRINEANRIAFRSNRVTVVTHISRVFQKKKKMRKTSPCSYAEKEVLSQNMWRSRARRQETRETKGFPGKLHGIM